MRAPAWTSWVKLCCVGFLGVFVVGPLGCSAASLADAADLEDLEAYGRAVRGVQRDMLALCESATGSEQFDLYRVFNESMGTWLQIDLLREALERSTATQTPDGRDRLRGELRQQARFALWELERNIADLEESIVPTTSARARLEASLLAVLQDARVSVDALAGREE
jgi:hypothetical protein